MTEDKAPERTVIECPAGSLVGTRAGDVERYRGIPYALAPLGNLRFAPPRTAPAWDGLLDATHFGAASAQNASAMETMLGQQRIIQSEDCLFLNIWAPSAEPDAGNRRPVMVWIHGGAFVTGSGSTPWYDGAAFARNHDVVVVTLNYRLGALGFLHLGDIGGERFAGSGNAGLLDQTAALGWVRDNIEAFGGDASNVTIFGESAGGMSVGAHLGLPASDGLFHKAVPQSGACANIKDGSAAGDVAARFLSCLDIGPNHLDRLFDVPLAEILAAQNKVMVDTGDPLAFEPVLDDVFMPRLPLEVVRSGGVADIPILTGTTLEEMKLFSVMDPSVANLDEGHLRARVGRAFPPERVEQALIAYTEATNAANARAGRDGATPGQIWTSIATDQVFREPAIALAEAQAVQGRGNAFMYLFTWSTPAFGGALGSCHALELPFVFDNLDKAGAGIFTGDGPERAELAAAMNQAWAAFARSGNPSGAMLGPWPAYEVGRRSTMVLNESSAVVDDPYGDLRPLWAPA